MTMSISVDDIAAPSADAWKPDIGETLKGTVTYAGTMTGESYDKKRTEEKLRIVVQSDDGEATIWATTNTDINDGGYAKRDAKAIAAAVRASGSKSLEVGGTLAMKRVDDVPTDMGAAKAFVAEYVPPAAGAVVSEDAADGAVSGLI